VRIFSNDTALLSVRDLIILLLQADKMLGLRTRSDEHANTPTEGTLVFPRLQLAPNGSFERLGAPSNSRGAHAGPVPHSWYDREVPDRQNQPIVAKTNGVAGSCTPDQSFSVPVRRRPSGIRPMDNEALKKT
jgi:hypothetical protein